MATIAKLVVEVEATTAGLQRELRRSQRFVEEFQRTVARARDRNTLGGTLSGLGAIGLGPNAVSALKGFERQAVGTFERLSEAARIRLARGDLNAEEYLREVRAIGKRVRETFKEEVGKLGGSAAGALFNPRQLESIFSAVDDAQRRAQRAFEAPTRSQQNVAAILANAQRAQQQALERVDLSRATGAIGKVSHDIGRKMAEAAFNDEVVRGIERLAASGKLTDRIRSKLVGELKPGGFGFGDSATFNEQSIRQAQTAIDRVNDRLKRRISAGRESLAEFMFSGGKRGINPEAFRTLEFDAKRKADRSIKAVLDHMRRNNTLSSDAAVLLTNQFKTLGAIPPDQALLTARRSIANLRKAYEAEVGGLSAQVARGTLSPAAFDRQQGILRQGLRGSLVALYDAFGDANLLSGSVKRAFGQAFRSVRGDAASEGSVLAQQMVAGFNQRFTREIGNARALRFSGRLSEEDFARSGARSAKAFNDELLKLRADLDRRGLLDDATAAFIDKQFKDAGTKAGSGFSGSLLDRLRGLGEAASRIGADLTQKITLPLVTLGGLAVKQAGDAETASRRLLISFGPAARQVEGMLNALLATVPATSIELKDMATRVAELFIPLGVAPVKAGEMARSFIQITKSLVALQGVRPERAFNALISAMIGQTREAKKLGIEMDQQSINQRAYQLGLARVGSQLSISANAQAAYSLLLDRSKLIYDAVNLSQDTFNFKLQVARKQLVETGIAFGTVLLPAMKQLVDGFIRVQLRLQQMPESAKKWAVAMVLIGAVVGPTLFVIGKLVAAVFALRTALLALSTVGAVRGLLALLGAGGPIALGVGIVGLLTFAFYGLRKAIHETSLSSAEYGRAISTMNDADLERTRVLLTKHREEIIAQRELIRARAGRVLLEARPGTQGPMPPVVVVDARAEAQIKSLTAQVDNFNMMLGEVGKRQRANAEQAKLYADLFKNYNDKLKSFNEQANEVLEVEKLRQARIEMANLGRDVNNALGSLRRAMKLGDAADELAAVQQLLDQVVNRLSTETDPTFSKQLEGFAIRLRTALDGSQKFDTKQIEQGVRDAVLRVERFQTKSAETRIGVLRDQYGLLAEELEYVRGLLTFINLLIFEQAKEGSAAVGLRRQAEALKDVIERFQTNAFENIFPDVDQQLVAVARKLKAADLSLQVAVQTPDVADDLKAEKAIATVRQELAALLSFVEVKLKSSALFTDDEIATILGQMAERMTQLGISADRTAEKLTKVARVARSFNLVRDAILGIVDAFGSVSENVRRMVDALGSVGRGLDELERFRQARDRADAQRRADPFKIPSFGDKLGEITALAGSIAAFTTAAIGLVRGFVGTFFTNTTGDRLREENRRALEQNNERLREVALQLAGFTNSTEQRLRAARFLETSRRAREIDSGFFNSIPTGKAVIRRNVRQDILDAIAGDGQPFAEDFVADLKKVGLTFAELEAIAKDAGITLFNSLGQALPGAFEQLAKYLRDAARAAFQFTNTLADQRTLTDLLRNVNDVADTPQADISQALGLLRTLAPKLAEEFFGGLDAAADPAALKSALKALVDAFIAEKINFEDFGALLEKGDLISIIELLEQGLDGLRETVNDVTSSLLNVPTGFKIALARFNAIDPFKPVIPPNVTNPLTGSTFTPAPSTVVQGNAVNIESVEVTIADAGDKDPDEMAEEFIAALRRYRFKRTGSTTLPGIDN